jgi:CelD/BcsL family acetyltransferase involved in cellulose biosynthesis
VKQIFVDYTGKIQPAFTETHMDLQLLTDFPADAEPWNDLLARSSANVPFLRHEYLRAWWQTRGGGEWSAECALAILRGSHGIAPLFFEPNTARLLLLGSIEISDYLDVIASPQDVAALVASLFARLDDSDFPYAWRALDLYNLPENSPTLAALRDNAQARGWQFSLERVQPTPSIPLPGDFDVYLTGIDKKQRHEIRRKIRRAEESGRNVRWYIVEHESTLDAEMEAFLQLMRHDPEKDAFLTEVMHSQMKQSIHAAFRAGWLQLAFLEVDGEKACGYLNFDYANKIWVYNSGLDRRFMDLSPGWVLLGYLLQWANENHRAEFDFMRGDEDYKYKFGGRDQHVMRAQITRD